MAPLTDAEDVGWFRIAEDSGVGAARRRAMALAKHHGYGEGRVGEVGIVVTELGTNLVRHAGEGAILLRVVHAGRFAGLEVVAVDSGPGVADLSAAMEDGRSSIGTLGVGLGAVSRLASSWDAYSLPGRGTVVVATMWPKGVAAPTAGAPAPAEVAALTRPIGGETFCGDGYALRRDGDVLRLLLSDGLGHGAAAATVTHEAIRVFREADPLPPAEMLTFLGKRLVGTRGVAAAVAEIDGASGSIRFAGLGNISGVLVSQGRRRGLVSQPGIVGHRGRSILDFTYQAEPGDLLVMQTDGLRDRWNLETYPGIVQHTPVVIAATLLRDAGVHQDDAGIVVARTTSRT